MLDKNQLPQYQCHKIVSAIKIGQIEPKPNPDTTGKSAAASYGAHIIPAEKGYDVFEVTAEYVNRHHPHTGGYYVRYEDGYESFSPAATFEEGYLPVLLPAGQCGLNFGKVLQCLHNGQLVARAGWNGKGMFIFLVPGSHFLVSRAPLLGIFEEGTPIDYCPHIDMRTADGKIVPWLASQTDVLAVDWVVVK